MRRVLVILATIATIVIGVRLSMPWMARRLIRSDPLARADLIVVLGGGSLGRTLEAATLYREGWAPRILLLRPPANVPESVQHQLGIRIPIFLDLQKDALRQMGVPASAVAMSPKTQDSTRNEAAATVEYVRSNGIRRIIVVTSPYHTARAGSLFDRAAKGTCEIVVHPDRYEVIDTSRWWRAFPDRYDVASEYLSRIYALFWPQDSSRPR